MEFANMEERTQPAVGSKIEPSQSIKDKFVFKI